MKIEIGQIYIMNSSRLKITVTDLKEEEIYYLYDVDPIEYSLSFKTFKEMTTPLPTEEPLDLNIALSNEEQFKAIQHENYLMYEDKNKKYDNAFGKSVQKYGQIAALTRMGDKFNRIEQFMLNGYEDSEESLIDSLRDLSNYLTMTEIEIKKGIKNV